MGAGARLGVGLLVAAWLAGCDQYYDRKEELMCEHSFRSDKDWSRISADTADARFLHEKFVAVRKAPAGEFSPGKVSWFANSRTNSFASCRFERCDQNYCYFHLQSYEREAEEWKIAFEHDVAARRVK